MPPVQILILKNYKKPLLKGCSDIHKDQLIFNQDFVVLKEQFKEFIRGIGTLAKAILILVGWLLAIGAIILAFVLFGWFIASLGATTIIIILLVLILLK